MIEQLKEYLLESRNSALPLKQPKRLRFLLTKGSLGGYGGRVTFFIFSDGQAYPALIAKIVRDPRDAHLLKTEYDSLKYVRENLSEAMREKIPRVFSLDDIGSYRVLLEEAVRGKSLDAIITGGILGQKNNALRGLNRIVDWLIGFQAELAAKENQQINGLNQNEYFAAPLDTFSSRYAFSGKEKNFLDLLRSELPRIFDTGFPLVFEHGDLSPINILFRRDKFWIIDWAAAKYKGLPLYDLFFLLTWFVFRNYRKEKEGGAVLENFNNIFLKDGEYAAAAVRLIKDYCGKLNISLASVKILFAMFLINSANREYAILSRQANRGYIIPVKPFDRGQSYCDGSLLKNGVYLNIFRRFVEQEHRYIFQA